VITRDRLSQVHLVNPGRAGTDRALLQSPRIALALDALLRVYDNVLLDAGKASDLPTELLATNARAVVVPDSSMTLEGRKLMVDQLKAVGFTTVTMLNKPAQPAGVAPRVVAA
jgi:succinoglycan biosynthesis transport protein ExoP